MDEPWYQIQGPSYEEIVKDMINVFGADNKRVIINTIEKLHPDRSFGSYRGYSTFIRTPLVSAINTDLAINMESLPEVVNER